MKNRANSALALTLAIACAVAAPLRSDARSGSCGCGESRQPLAKQAFRGACPQIFYSAIDCAGLQGEMKKRCIIEGATGSAIDYGPCGDATGHCDKEAIARQVEEHYKKLFE